MDMFIDYWGATYLKAPEIDVLNDVIKVLFYDFFENHGTLLAVHCLNMNNERLVLDRTLHCKNECWSLEEDIAYAFAMPTFEKMYSMVAESPPSQFCWHADELEEGSDLYIDTMLLKLDDGYIYTFIYCGEEELDDGHIALFGLVQAICRVLAKRKNGAKTLAEILPNIELNGIDEVAKEIISTKLEAIFNSDLSSIQEWKISRD